MQSYNNMEVGRKHVNYKGCVWQKDNSKYACYEYHDCYIYNNS